MAALGTSISYETLQLKSSSEIKEIFSNLRKEESMINAMVYSYTYSPLVGLVSETGPDDKTTNYKYDAFNRLETIRDHKNRIIKHFDYHYANE